MKVYIVLDYHQSHQGAEIEAVYSYRPDAEEHAKADPNFVVSEHEIETGYTPST